jgi:hypothetical protein
MVFSSSSCRETAKNVIKEIEGEISRKAFFSLKFSPHGFLTQMFSPKNNCGVFELHLLRSAWKCKQTKQVKTKT